MERHDITFTSGGTALRGWLYRAAETGARPGVVLAHGLSAVKEMFLDDYAATFAVAGINALVYDHAGFGASDGSPRQSPSPSTQLRGYRDAIATLGDDAGTDERRLGIWGTSFSGGHVIMLAAEDLPVRCAVAQVPNLGVATPSGREGALVEAVGAALTRDEAHRTIAATTPDHDGPGVMYDDEAHEWFHRVAAARAPAWRNELAIAGLLKAALVRPADFVDRARVPLLLLVAPDDRLAPPGCTADLTSSPLVQVVELEGGHFSAYETGFATTSGLATSWFARHLAG